VTEPHRPLLGEPDAPCRACGAPLAADQRYCLQCGTRRAEARLPFLEILAGRAPRAAAAAPPSPGPAGPGPWLGRVSANAAAVAGVACLLLALGVGVLIGGLGSGDSSASAAPQIITVGGAPATAVPAPTTAAPATTATTTTPDAPAKSTKKKTAKQSKTTSSAVKDLGKSTGGDYAKKSEKLPKTLGTGGAPPPKDTSGTAIGGGSDTESIG
jgi:hypothetical protein